MKNYTISTSLDEVVKAIKLISSGKSPGVDGIPADIFKHGGISPDKEIQVAVLFDLEKGVVPQTPKGCLHRSSGKVTNYMWQPQRYISSISRQGETRACSSK